MASFLRLPVELETHIWQLSGYWNDKFKGVLEDIDAKRHRLIYVEAKAFSGLDIRFIYPVIDYIFENNAVQTKKMLKKYKKQELKTVKVEHKAVRSAQIREMKRARRF